MHFGFRNRVLGFPGSPSQFLHAFQRFCVGKVFTLDEPCPDDCSGAALAAPAVDVNDLVGVEFALDVTEDPVVAGVDQGPALSGRRIRVQ